MRSLICVASAAVYLPAITFPSHAQIRGTPGLKSRPVPLRKAIPSPASTLSYTTVLPANLPLRIQLDHRYRMRLGAPIIGKLIDPVYSGDHIVLPKNTVVDGTIVRLQPIGKEKRTWALLDGDVTPLR
jgi:hypothetical protein